jgi:phosphatidate phosphatase PAH1
LICNKINDQYIDIPSSNLFTKEDLVQVEYLLKDHKQVDYLMKINDELNIFNPQIIIDKLSSVKQISMAYAIEPKKIKYPEHLILE